MTNTRFGGLNLVDLAGSERSIFFDRWTCVLFHSLQEQNDSFFWWLSFCTRFLLEIVYWIIILLGMFDCVLDCNLLGYAH